MTFRLAPNQKPWKLPRWDLMPSAPLLILAWEKVERLLPWRASRLAAPTTGVSRLVCAKVSSRDSLEAGGRGPGLRRQPWGQAGGTRNTWPRQGRC